MKNLNVGPNPANAFGDFTGLIWTPEGSNAIAEFFLGETHQQIFFFLFLCQSNFCH